MPARRGPASSGNDNGEQTGRSRRPPAARTLGRDRPGAAPYPDAEDMDRRLAVAGGEFGEPAGPTGVDEDE